MFSGGSSSLAAKSGIGSVSEAKGDQIETAVLQETDAASPGNTPAASLKTTEKVASGGKRSGIGSPQGAAGSAEQQKKRRSSGVSARASNLIAQAKKTLFTQGGSRSSNNAGADSRSSTQTPLQKLGKQDQALAVPQGQQNNAAGGSLPGPRSTFRVGVWEDRNRKCRRTMEDTHAFLYNFLCTPAPALDGDSASLGPGRSVEESAESRSRTSPSPAVTETDNGYFAIFDGHAGTFAADWCGKKLHLLLEETIRKNPNSPVPELLDQTFTSVDAQLELLPHKNSGCTAAIALLRWEDRVPSSQSATGSQAIASAVAKATEEATKLDKHADTSVPDIQESTHARLRGSATRQRVLYTANVGDARIILCRAGKAMRLSYDHKGTDEYEGKRISNAGGLILNSRVNGVLAVTRALGDTYMKNLVTGHPYTTETVIQPDSDEFIIIACDGLWDVCSDQEAVDLIRNVQDPTAAAKLLVDHALSCNSTDNLSCMTVRLDKHGLLEHQNKIENAIGVEGDMAATAKKPSEADQIVAAMKQKIAESGISALGVSATNHGRGHGTGQVDDNAVFAPTAIEGSVEEEPNLSQTPLAPAYQSG